MIAPLVSRDRTRLMVFTLFFILGREEGAYQLNVKKFSKGHKAHPILRLGHPSLRDPSVEVDPQSAETMETMKLLAASVVDFGEDKTWGLAAPQIGINQRVLYYADFDRESRKVHGKYFLINPTYEAVGSEEIDSIEACLSLPDLVGLVKRHKEVRLNAMRYDGETFEEIDEEITGDSVRMFQHEIDHLDGVLYVDLITDNKNLYYMEEFQEFVVPNLKQ